MQKLIWTPELDARVVELTRDGWSYQAIAAELHKLTGAKVSRNMVAGKVFRLSADLKFPRARTCRHAVVKRRRKEPAMAERMVAPRHVAAPEPAPPRKSTWMTSFHVPRRAQLQPSSPAEIARLVAEAEARGRVTVLPPGFADGAELARPTMGIARLGMGRRR